MGTTTAISIDRFRRRKAHIDTSELAAYDTHPLTGAVLGTLERRYGLMSSEETITVADVIASSGDLAVADRLAFVAAMERRVSIVVVEHDGSYVACATERALTASDLPALRVPANGAARIMSIATERGITPALGPLCA